MPYLNLDLDYRTHPKTVRLIGLLGREAEIFPIRLWCYCGKHHSVDGKLLGYSSQEIESAVGWWGKPEEMIKAMLKTKHIIALADGFQIVDWLEHNGHLAMFKERARKASAARWGLRNPTSNPKELIKESYKQSPIPTIPTVPTNNNTFALFWKAYPRKVARDVALKTWGKLAPQGDLLKTILSALESHKKQWTDKKFIPYPATWLNQKRWEDEIAKDRKQALEDKLYA